MPGSVLFISAMNGDPWGGSEEFWFRLAIWMAKNGYRVGCCFFDWPSGKEDRIRQLQEAGCATYALPNPRHAKLPLQKIILRKKGSGLLKKIVTQSWDLACISQGGYEDVTHRPFRQLYRHLGKYVLISHNYNDNHRLSRSRIQNLHTWVSGAALNMGDAGRIFEGVKKASGLSVPRQFTLNNPLTIPWQAEPTDWPEKDEQGRYVFAMLAQLDTSRKAQDVLIRALSSAGWKERNWVLYLYGGGEDKEALEKLIAAHEMTGRIKLMGHTRDVYGVLKKTHLLFQVTHIDAMPLSVTEAMNMARPCMVSRVGDMPLWIGHGKNGYIAPAVTEQAIDATLQQAWAEKDNWKQMGQEAHRVFREKYPQPYEQYYANLLLNL